MVQSGKLQGSAERLIIGQATHLLDTETPRDAIQLQTRICGTDVPRWAPLTTCLIDATSRLCSKQRVQRREEYVDL